MNTDLEYFNSAKNIAENAKNKYPDDELIGIIYESCAITAEYAPKYLRLDEHFDFSYKRKFIEDLLKTMGDYLTSK